jgi:prophage regulatory protein
MKTIANDQPPFARKKPLPQCGTSAVASTGAVALGSRRNALARQPIEALTLPDALLKVQTVCAATGLSSATIFRKTAAGAFPAPVRLGARCTRWKSGDVRSWLAAQTATAASVK